MKKLAVARLWLEVNSFSPLVTGIAEFEALEWTRGTQALEQFAGTPTEMGAVADFARTNTDWDVTVSRCAAAVPGGPMSDALFERFMKEVLADLEGTHWDAVYLSLHGGLATESRTTPDLECIRAVRLAVSDCPLGVTFDMHANIAPETVNLVDLSSGYKTLPHVDMFETAHKTLANLRRMARGEIAPVGAYARPGCLLHSFNMRTTDGPMLEIEKVAEALADLPILDVTPYGGFPFTDSPNAGASVLVYADAAPERAQHVAETVSRAILEHANEFMVQRPSAEEGLRQALSMDGGMRAVLETADNTYSGGIADTPGLLRPLLDLAPAVPCVFAYFCDVELVDMAHRSGEGAIMDCHIGGKVTDAFGPPILVKARVTRLTDGVFRNEGPMFEGIEVRLGRTAVLSVGQVRIVVTERRQPVNDRAFFALHDIDLNKVAVLCVKAKNHFRAAIAPLCSAIMEVDSIGPAMIDLRKLPYKHAPLNDFVHENR